MATIIRMPEVLTGTSEAIISSWEIAEGAEVSVGDLLAEIETEKAVVEYAAEESGVLGKYLAQPGQTIAVGTPIALLLTEAGEQVDLDALLGDSAGPAAPVESGHTDGSPTPAAAAEPTAAQGSAAEPVPAPTAAAEPAPAPASSSSGAPDHASTGGRIFASPLARKMARERGIPLDSLTGTGPGGRIVRRDVEAHEAPAASNTPAPSSAVPSGPAAARAAEVPASTYEDIPHTGMRRAIARRLTESKSTVPHFYLTADCTVDELLALRAKLNAAGTTKISVNDFVIKAVAAAFQEVPEANVVWTETALRRFTAVDVAVAVATDGGLVTPVLRGVQDMPLGQISRSVAEVAGRARQGRLRQEELEGGTFTVSNLGMYGTKEFSAILNPPQSGILAVGAALQQPMVVDGEVSVATVMRCTLSADHRAVDGALAAQWLHAFQKAIEQPLLMLV